MSEDVKVFAEAPPINTEDGTLSDSKTFVQVTQLPVNYRGSTTSPLAAIDTVPGVQQDGSGTVSIGGGTPAMVQYSVDGISAVNVRANGALGNLNPSSELIREFKVTSNNNDAEFSQVGDATITNFERNWFHAQPCSNICRICSMPLRMDSTKLPPIRLRSHSGAAPGRPGRSVRGFIIGQ